MMNLRTSVAAIAAAFVMTVPALAADYTVDPAHSHVGFEIRHLFGRVPGEFKDFSGNFTFDEKNAKGAKVEFTAKAKSIATGVEKRDNHLRSGDFFDADKFPELKFEGTKLAPHGKGKYKLSGNLTMHGVTKPVTFDVEFLGQGKDPWGSTRAGFTAKAKINRKDFGISWNKTLDTGSLMLGEDVALQLDVEATQDKAAAK